MPGSAVAPSSGIVANWHLPGLELSAIVRASGGHRMDDQPTFLSGRVTDVGPTYVVLGITRIELGVVALAHPACYTIWREESIARKRKAN